MLVLGGCSREQQDWRAAEGRDTIEAYSQFTERHPDSELVTQARMRITQLGEESDWQYAGSADTADAYKAFLSKYPNGKWSQEARIRMENFSLSSQAALPLSTTTLVPAADSTAATAAARLAPATAGSGLAVPGEAAVPPTRPAAAEVALGTAAGSGITTGPATSSATGGPGAPTTRPSSADVATGPARSPGAGTLSLALASSATPADTRIALTNPSQGAFGIQLGAFATEASADGQWRTLAGRFGPELQGLHQRIVPIDTPSGRIYRLQADVGPEARARAICDSLRKQSQGCVAVLPH
jgi:hypothetical protein